MELNLVNNLVNAFSQTRQSRRTQLSAAIEDYMVYCYALAPRTRAIYREHLSRLVISLGDIPLKQVTGRQLTKFMSSLRRQDGGEYSPAYLHQAWRTLHTFLEFCTQEEWLTANPMRRVPKPQLESGPKPRLKLDQVQQLLEAAQKTTFRERDLAIILLMVDSGLRLDEVVGLRAADVRLDDKTLYARSTKTHAVREVPINSALEQAIHDYLQQRPPFHSSDDPFFLGKNGQALTKNAVHEMLVRLRKYVDFRLHAHLLRHTFANLYIRRGETRKLQKILGHSRMETTSRFYTNPEFEDIQREHRFASPTAQLSNKASQESSVCPKDRCFRAS